MFFAKNWPKIIFSIVKQKVIFPHIAVVQEDIDVLVLLMKWLYHQMLENCIFLKRRRNNVLLNENKFKPVLKYQ
jgi:hypothetical protein